jgi:hypothetical protein
MDSSRISDVFTQSEWYASELQYSMYCSLFLFRDFLKGNESDSLKLQTCEPYDEIAELGTSATSSGNSLFAT